MESKDRTPQSRQVFVPKKGSEPEENPPSELAHPQNSEENRTFYRLSISNLHKWTTKEELELIFASQPFPAPNRTFVIFYGPKSTGKAWVEYESLETALEVLKKMNGFIIRDQPISVTLPQKNREERKIKQAKKKKKPVIFPYSNELEQIKSKYSDSFRFLSEEVPIRFTISFKPSDPEFPFDIEKLHLNIEIPEDYPEEPCIISVINEDIPTKLRGQMDSAALSRAQLAYKNKPMMLGLIRWLDNNLEKLLIDKEMNQDYQLAQSGIQILTPQQIKSHYPQTEQKEKEAPAMSWMDHQLAVTRRAENGENPEEQEEEGDEQSEDESEGEQDSEAEENKDGQIKAKDNKFATTTAHKGTQIKAEGLKMSEIGILECSLIRFVVACTRCKYQVEVSLAPNASYAVECSGCHQAHIITYRPDCQFEASCLECSNRVDFKKVPLTGMLYSENCTNCHKKLSLSAERVKYVKIRPMREPPKDVIVQKKKKQRDPRMIGIKVGTPLPEEGTCKHYKRSFRWFRFPCCQRIHPCDICHDENSPDGHESQRANRMVCGYCSKEQIFSSKCIKCNSTFGEGGKNFWEGGKGCRDPSKLSRNDPHKYKHLGSKTSSQKSKRVGPKPKESGK